MGDVKRKVRDCVEDEVNHRTALLNSKINVLEKRIVELEKKWKILFANGG